MSAAVRPEIVVGVDGSEESRTALHWAIDEALLRARPLRVVHVIGAPYVLPAPVSMPLGVDTASERAQRLIDEAVEYARRHAPGLPVDGAVERGSPTAVLLRIAEQLPDDIFGSLEGQSECDDIVRGQRRDVSTRRPSSR